MAISSGSHKLGPDNATLSVRTRKGGAAAKAGHNLLIDVTAWSATLEVAEQTSIALSADPRSLKVREGTGGITGLGDEDRAGIDQTINDEVLRDAAIEFRSTAVEGGPGSDRLSVRGELELSGQRHPIAFELTAGDDGRLAGSATVKQSDWGMKPYSALFGTLKVLDEVTVEVAAQLP
jgi:hypothetical protein